MFMITKRTSGCKLKNDSKWFKQRCSLSHNVWCEIIKDFGSFHLSVLSYSARCLSSVEFFCPYYRMAVAASRIIVSETNCQKPTEGKSLSSVPFQE